jgi:hypothetical protein
MGEFDKAEAFYSRCLQVAEENGWPLLVEVGKSSLASLLFYRWFERRDPALLASAVQKLRTVNESSRSEQAGESYATLILALYFSGNEEEAKATLRHARERSNESWVTDRIWLDFVEAVINRQSWIEPLDWFRSHDFKRAVRFIARVERIIGSA